MGQTPLLHTTNSEQPRYRLPALSGQAEEMLEDPQRVAAQALLEDYLDHVCLPLMDTLDYRDRLEMRREVAPHLQSLAAAYEEMGMAPEVAMRKALAKFGPPESVARLWRPARLKRRKQFADWLRRQWPGMAVTLSTCAVLAFGFFFLTSATTPVQPTNASTVQEAKITTALPTFHHAFVVDKIPCTECHAVNATASVEKAVLDQVVLDETRRIQQMREQARVQASRPWKMPKR